MDIRVLIAALRERIANLTTPSVGAIVSSIGKLEAKLEAAIKREVDKLAGLNATRVVLEAKIDQTNKDVDAAYKLLNNVSKVLKA